MPISKQELRRKAEEKKAQEAASQEVKGTYQYGVYELFNVYIEAMCMNDTECFNLIGQRKSDLKRMMARDSMLLSTIIDFVEANGDTVKFSLYREGEADDQSVIDIERLLKEKIDSNLQVKRLAFLTYAFRRYKVPRSEVAKRLGLDSSTAYKWFAMDDIRFRQIVKIAEVLNCSIRMDITVSRKKVPDGHRRISGSIVYSGETALD